MLLNLTIKNYALIDDLEVRFTEGFSVITGETGAGKSILLGALALLLGKRADTTALSNRHKKCVVEGTFDIGSMGMKNLFAVHDLDYDEIVFLRREINSSGRSRAFVNDTPVNLTLLKKIGDALVDVHSQHQTLMLGDTFFQLQVLDDFVDQPELLENYQKVYTRFKELTKRQKELSRDIEQARRDEDYYRFLFTEFDKVILEEEDFNRLLEKERFLSHAEEVIQSLGHVDGILSDEEQSAGEKLELASEALEKVQEYLPEIVDLAKRLREVSIEIKDIAGDISRLNTLTEYNPNEMVEVRDKLDQVYRLQQKHHTDSIAGLIAVRDELGSKLEKISIDEEKIESIERDISKCQEELSHASNALHRSRLEKSASFSHELSGILGHLGMNEARFEVRITELPAYSDKGKDKIDFLFSANRGSTPGEIASIASGGELSRLMLAIKSLITKKQLLPTVIFDEIDAGVSGEVAGKVGNILKKMSNHHQLIVISHLPQIAAKADSHFKVYKTSDDTQTFTLLKKLNDNDRVDEIAKLLSDEKVSLAAKETARELLGQ
jgi:DNA repair protein RecN (Recombination protein N)